ncbi:unnamed protein product, partial [Soboliphyme baturini]|uniref:ZnMc domain-containing protein n=1 Tax=Soboliphyme baturini TaxID=241478 RepID=A0A183II79_9BILA
MSRDPLLFTLVLVAFATSVITAAPITQTHYRPFVESDVGLTPSGQLNHESLELMETPRCGNRPTRHDRNKRFVPHKTKWQHNRLTWQLLDPYDLLGTHEKFIVRTALHRAFDDWSAASRKHIIFVEQNDENKDQRLDVKIFFAKGEHNDSLPFDGTAGIVAHGFYPQNGNLHFDADEQWTLNMDQGINFYQVALHEIGHLLGLEHSTNKNAVMYPIDRPYDPFFKLSDDDINGIKHIYAP